MTNYNDSVPKWEAAKLKGGEWTVRWENTVTRTIGQEEVDVYPTLIEYSYLVSYRAYDLAKLLNKEWITPIRTYMLPDPFSDVDYLRASEFETSPQLKDN